MPYIRLFNPENDIMLQWPAERTISSVHTLSPNVEALRRAGAMLPVWWSSPGDAVIVHDDDSLYSRKWLDEMSALFPFLSHVSIVSATDTGKPGAPWGWSGDAARRLSRAGAECPSIAQLERMRMLSHRCTSLMVMEYLKQNSTIPLPLLPTEATTVEEVQLAVASSPNGFYIKSPWSSSGRGVVRFDTISEKVLQRIGGMIRRQGSVMVEQALNGIQDFAMLYHIADGKAQWKGYSLFFNSHSSYSGNLLCDDATIEHRLVSAGADRKTLIAIRHCVANALSEIIGRDYTGWLGVDMLLDRDGMIAPCIEVNLRMTMGVVAHFLAERILAPDTEAVYSVEPHSPREKNNSPTIVDGRLIAGELMLTPPGGAFDFKISVTERNR